MNKRISLSLSKRSINGIIKKINKMPETVEKGIEDGIKEVMEGAYQEVISRTPYDTGDTANSTSYIIGNGKATLRQDGEHVLYNEFGTGPVGAASQHPEPPSNWVYRNEGWTYYNNNSSSKYYGIHFTLGQIAHAQMYHGGQYIRKNINKIIKKKVGVALSRI